MDKRISELLVGKRLRATSITPHERSSHNDERNDFESDLGRALFSSAARRLHDKTQVIPLTSDDNIHSRLTHSMEVMNIGASLAKDICFNSDFRNRYGIDDIYKVYEPLRAILQTVCLVHDIGNPPFGHFGEQAICDYFKQLFKADENLLGGYTHWMKDFTQYDGNAQGFRVITKLQFIDDLYGLNLTKSCLASYLKYPNTGNGDKKHSCISLHKHGVFCVDKDYMDKVMEGISQIGDSAYKRHPFVFLVEAADSICYLSMDLEDAYNKGWFTLERLYNEWSTFSNEPEGAAAELFDTLRIAGSAGSSAGRKGFIRFRINIIKYLVALAVKNYLREFEKILAGEYNKELIFDDAHRVAQFLQKFCIEHIYRRKEIQSVELTGWSVINGLLDIYTKLLLSDNEMYRNHGEAMISQSVLRANKMDFLAHDGQIRWSPEDCCYIKTSDGSKITDVDSLCDKLTIDALPNYFRLRIIVDFISGMTDKFAVKHYQKLSGQRI
ncbi:MAG: dNTP triphosphohydrolase [Bacteroidaceae bacterium]|nr:dNTP triphosphohydrolase [Bacteroidaceae bacterium]